MWRLEKEGQVHDVQRVVLEVRLMVQLAYISSTEIFLKV